MHCETRLFLVQTAIVKQTALAKYTAVCSAERAEPANRRSCGCCTPCRGIDKFVKDFQAKGLPLYCKCFQLQ